MDEDGPLGRDPCLPRRARKELRDDVQAVAARHGFAVEATVVSALVVETLEVYADWLQRTGAGVLVTTAARETAEGLRCHLAEVDASVRSSRGSF